MKTRCYNKDSSQYHSYGGRGITVCEEWKTSFKAFYDWGMSHGYTDELTIDRIDVNGNYEPSNCRWVTAHEQSRNRRNNRMISFNGETKCMVDWALSFNLHPSVLRNRLNLGWGLERALKTPVKH